MVSEIVEAPGHQDLLGLDVIDLVASQVGGEARGPLPKFLHGRV
jgi:hypothetical protein